MKLTLYKSDYTHYAWEEILQDLQLSNKLKEIKSKNVFSSIDEVTIEVSKIISFKLD